MPLQGPARLLPATSWCKLAKCADLTARTALFTQGRNTQTLKSKTAPGQLSGAADERGGCGAPGAGAGKVMERIRAHFGRIEPR